MPAKPAIMPCLVYRDAPRAIAFLCDAFGFTRHAVHADGGHVHHAELSLHGNIVMLSSASERAASTFGLFPMDELQGRSPLCICVVIADPDAHYACAVAAGAEIITALQDNAYGGRGYDARDCEGIAWNFGSYDPWETGSHFDAKDA